MRCPLELGVVIPDLWISCTVLSLTPSEPVCVTLPGISGEKGSVPFLLDKGRVSVYKAYRQYEQYVQIRCNGG